MILTKFFSLNNLVYVFSIEQLIRVSEVKHDLYKTIHLTQNQNN